jgi:hypothetical protein
VLRQLVIIIGIITVAGLAAWPFVQPIPDPSLAADSGTSSPLTTGDELKPCTLDSPGYITATLYGSINTEFDLHGDQLQCAGKLNALNGRSRIALVVEQTLDDSESSTLVFVIGMENVEENTNQQGLETNLTIVDQSNGIFFGTQGTGRCWTDLKQVLVESDSSEVRYRAEGEVYCSGAVPQIKGPGSVTISNFNFAGELHRTVEPSDSNIAASDE